MSLNALMFLPILPELLLLSLGVIVLVLDMILSSQKSRNLGWVVAVGMGLIILLSLFSRPGSEPTLIWGGMISHDWLSFSFKLLFIFGAGITALFAMDYKELGSRGEFYLLMIVSTIGMCFMASATDIIMLYLAIETTSIPLYILAGFFNKDKKSTEAGFKYFLFGAMASAIMLYGFSLLFGFSGTTGIGKIAVGLMEGSVSITPIVGSLFLVLIGFAFKISAVPFHFWAPDVYDGAPTPVAGFLSTASKAAGFVVLIRVLLLVYPMIALQWGAVIAAISVASMTLGNLIALSQRNIKRMLAYSSIAQAGYILIGVAAISPLGTTGLVLYVAVYLVTNLAAFGVVAAFGRIVNSDNLDAYSGMSRRSPALALAMMVALLSLAGMPPFGGFIGKVIVFAAAIQSGLIWLAVIGVLNSIIGLFYYMTALKYIYLYRSEDDDKPIPLTRSYKLALVILTAGIILMGSFFGPWFNWASTAASAMF